ncbi:MAG: enoyl-CoA hydratase/isomerase family protein [Acidimicrobiia bacterium]
MNVTYELDADIATVTLNRPDSFNAITGDLTAELAGAMARAGDEARAVIVTGAGKAFCAGADLAEIAAGYERDGPQLGSVLERNFHPAVHALLDAPVPTVAAINGAAAGAGLGLALACDLRVMSESAFIMSAFAGIGLAPDSGTTWWLPHHLGVSRALEITLTNRRVPADEAKELGLSLDTVGADQLISKAREYATALADLPTDALVTTRRLIRQAAGSDFDSALEMERTEQDRLGRSAEHAEGVSAFLAKRKPDYRAPRSSD